MALEPVDLISNIILTPASEYLIYPWLLPGRFTLLSGPTDVGKTTLTLEMIATCIRGGHLWDKFPCRPIKSVLYLHGEHTLQTIQEAAAARGDIPRGIVHIVHDFHPLGPRVLINGLPNKPFLNELQACVALTRPDLIVVEPISTFIEGDENDNYEARAVVQIFCEIAAASNAAVLGHHHFGKGFFDAEKQASKPHGSATGETRGGMAFEDAAERVIYVKPDKQGHIVIETVKIKGYKITPVVLDFDADTLTYQRLPNPPIAQRDLLALYEHYLTHPDMSYRDREAYFKEQWKKGTAFVRLHWRRAQRVGLVPSSPPDEGVPDPSPTPQGSGTEATLE